MSEQPPKFNTRDERVAAQVRQALGPFNDDSRPVVECVERLVATLPETNAKSTPD